MTATPQPLALQPASGEPATFDPISWDVARRVAAQVARRGATMDRRTFQKLQADFDELTEVAERLVIEATGLQPLHGPARARVTDRAGWVSANLVSFRRLIGPLASRLGNGSLPGVLAPLARATTGAQVGVILGWMSGRVLGQYDLLLTEDAGEDAADQDLVYYVGPNVLALERRHGFPPREFRLWIALHEVTHRLQFTGVPWLREHFLGLVEQGIDLATSDPTQIFTALKRAAGDIRLGRNPLAEAGIVGMLAREDQLKVLHEVQALMSLLEGHGDVTMDRAGEGMIPGAARFSRILRQRRAEAKGFSRFFQQLMGLEAKMRQYAEGERFVEKVEEAGGRGALDRVWESAAMLPTLEEIRQPERWLTRTGGPSLTIA
jgi:coenzyme F420 biosynthesis associated uncharacterized protein